MRSLSKEEAHQFALLQLAGVPVADIVTYFVPPGTKDEEILASAKEWPGQREVLEALRLLTGGVPWQQLSPEERLKIALDKHYAEMAYFLWSHNYADLTGGEKGKADDCRRALEAKLAGTAGKGNFLEVFYEEYMKKQKGAVTLPMGRA